MTWRKTAEYETNVLVLPGILSDGTPSFVKGNVTDPGPGTAAEVVKADGTVVRALVGADSVLSVVELEKKSD